MRKIPLARHTAIVASGRGGRSKRPRRQRRTEGRSAVLLIAARTAQSRGRATLLAPHDVGDLAVRCRLSPDVRARPRAPLRSPRPMRSADRPSCRQGPRRSAPGRQVSAVQASPDVETPRVCADPACEDPRSEGCRKSAGSPQGCTMQKRQRGWPTISSSGSGSGSGLGSGFASTHPRT